MSEAVRYEAAAGVATVTMDHPANRNALTPAMLDGLGDGLAEARTDHSVRVVVLTHTGPAFCAGADLSARAGEVVRPRFSLPAVLSAMQDCPKPVIARIAGHCLGGGVGLAAACDLSVASEDARFGFTEVRVGVAPAIISVVVLPKMRRGDALELFLSGERVEATRAAEVGLITRAVPAAALDEAVDLLVGAVMRGGPRALAAAKRLVFSIPRMERSVAFDHTARLSRDLFESEEAAEGMAAFREKRQASWVPPGA
ncbi:MAG: enoyl-CoA hydratase/isomerase family protein [Acidimicrobiales bacterium]